MKTLKVPVYFTFTNWLIIVIAGSLLCPFVGHLITGQGAFSGRRDSIEDSFEVAALCMLVSAVFSLPALIIMLVTHLMLNRNGVSKKRHMLVQNMVHLGVSLLTFGVIYSLTGFDDIEFLVILILSYVPVGLLVWNITYSLQKEKATHVVKGADVLDEF